MMQKTFCWNNKKKVSGKSVGALTRLDWQSLSKLWINFKTFSLKVSERSTCDRPQISSRCWWSLLEQPLVIARCQKVKNNSFKLITNASKTIKCKSGCREWNYNQFNSICMEISFSFPSSMSPLKVLTF